MVIQNFRDIKGRAKKTLEYTPWDVKKTVFVYGAVPLGISLVLSVISLLLSSMSDGAGGLAAMNTYNILDTVSSVLSLGFFLFQIFWNPALFYCALMILREQNPWPNGLFRGFKKWATVLRFYILLFVLLMAVAMAASTVASTLSLPFMSGFYEMFAQIPQTEAEMIAYMERIPTAQLLQTMAPMLAIYLVLLAIVLIPIFYRVRFALPVILDEEQVGARAALLFSFRLTKGSCLQLFQLDLSFWWYYLLLFVCNLIPYGALLPIFSSWSIAAADLLCNGIACLAMLAVYMLGLMKVTAANAVAYDHLRTVPQLDLPQLPEETAHDL